jgi:hypothetical protein
MFIEKKMYLAKTVVVASLLYATPKALTYLSTAPDSIVGHVDRLRVKIHDLKETSRDLVGEKSWFIMTQVFANNAWVASLITSYLLYSSGQSVDTHAKRLNIVSAMASFTTVVWLARKAFNSIRS